MRKAQTQFPFKDDRKNFEYLFLTALAGLVLFRLFFSFYFTWIPETKYEDFKAYFLGWVFVPMAGWAFTWFLEKVRKRWIGDKPSFYPILALANFILVLFLFHPRWTNHIDSFLRLGLFLFVEFIGLWIAVKKKDEPGSSLTGLGDPYYFWMMGLAVAWLFNIKADLGGVVIKHPLNYLILIGGFWAFHWGIPKYSSITKNPARNKTPVGKILKKLLIYGAVFIGIFYLVVDPRFKYDRHHFSFYLGPLSDLVNGKSLLNNINAQYGVLVFYFLKVFFRFLPLGYTSFSLVNTILIVLQYFLFYFIARGLFKGWALPLFGLLALLLINHFAASGTNPVLYPSTGPLRFGFIYLLAALILLRNKYPAWKNSFYFGEAAVIGAATFWSFEVFIYTVPAYLALLVYESFNFGGTSGFDRTGFQKRAAFLAAWLLAIGVFLYRDIFLRTGELPHWSYYFDYISAYQGGVGMVWLPGIGYWSLIIGTLYVSLFCVGWISFKSFREKKTLPANFNVIFLLVFYGMTQFLYFLWRSHPNNLFHICTPTLLLLTYWLYYLRHFDPLAVPKALRKAGFSLAVIFVCVYLQKTVQITQDKLRDQSMPLPQMAEQISLALRDRPREDDFAKAAGALMEKYSKGIKYLVYFFGERGLEVSMYEGISKTYPYNDMVQTAFCLPVLIRVLTFDPHLKSGDFIYISKDSQRLIGGDDPNSTMTFEYHLWKKIKKSFVLKLVEEKNGISVYRVKKPSQSEKTAPKN
jgi:hypothetical protein